MRCQASSSIASTAPRTVLIIRTPIEYCHPARSRRSKTLVFQNPESARSSLTPLAPARSTPAISSSVKRLMPFCVFAEPFLRRMCNVSRVSARVPEDRVVAQQPRVAVAGALLQASADLADEAVDIDHEAI